MSHRSEGAVSEGAVSEGAVSEGTQTPLWRPRRSRRAPAGMKRRVLLVQYVSRPRMRSGGSPDRYAVEGKQARNTEDDAREFEDARQSGWMRGRSR
jgi:hypothetical protein